MSLRREFVTLAVQPGANMSELCRGFKISRKTGYKWRDRYAIDGAGGVIERSRRPRSSPERTARSMEEQIVQLRQAHPAWGARKLLRRLRDLGHTHLPAPSTAQAILKRRGCIATEESAKHKAFTRFERDRPNALWQMDFKGHFALADGKRCHPLTVLDDHARFSLAIRACANEQGNTVQGELTALFQRYGLPDSMGMDNGPPWGDSYGQPYTPLSVWLIQLGIDVWHSRPRHPQTLGKDERFHRTLKAELIAREYLSNLIAAQRRFDAWREVYNFERPHDALNGDTPATRYRPSTRPFPQRLPPIEYAPDCHVRKVFQTGHLSFKGQRIRVGKAFNGYPIALRETTQEGVWDAYFCQHKIKSIDLRQPQSLTCQV